MPYLHTGATKGFKLLMWVSCDLQATCRSLKIIGFGASR